MSNKTASDLAKRALLYDFYGPLLTAHQQEIYEDFAYNDMSVSEIANSRDISRQAVSDLIKRIDKILLNYEDKLGLVSKFNSAEDKVREIIDLTKNISDKNEDEVLENIRIAAESMLDDF